MRKEQEGAASTAHYCAPCWPQCSAQAEAPRLTCGSRRSPSSCPPPPAHRLAPARRATPQRSVSVSRGPGVGQPGFTDCPAIRCWWPPSSKVKSASRKQTATGKVLHEAARRRRGEPSIDDRRAGRGCIPPTCSPISSMLFISAATFSGSAGRRAGPYKEAALGGSGGAAPLLALQPTFSSLLSSPGRLTIAARALKWPPDGRHRQPHHLQSRAYEIWMFTRYRNPFRCCHLMGDVRLECRIMRRHHPHSALFPTWRSPDQSFRCCRSQPCFCATASTSTASAASGAGWLAPPPPAGAAAAATGRLGSGLAARLELDSGRFRFRGPVGVKDHCIGTFASDLRKLCCFCSSVWYERLETPAGTRIDGQNSCRTRTKPGKLRRQSRLLSHVTEPANSPGIYTSRQKICHADRSLGCKPCLPSAVPELAATGEARNQKGEKSDPAKV